MNKFGFAVAAAVLGALTAAAVIGLKYSQATLLFGLISAFSAPLVIHKISSVGWAVGMLIGLAIFASFPLKKLFQVDGFVNETPVTLAYVAILWVIGFGWKREWS